METPAAIAAKVEILRPTAYRLKEYPEKVLALLHFWAIT